MDIAPENNNLSEEDKALALAVRYYEKSQNDKAIETLKKLVDSGNQNPSIYLVLGGFYECESLHEPAEDYCKQALKLAISQESIEEQIAAKVALTKIKSISGSEEGNCWCKEATDDFDALPQSTRESDGGESLRSLMSGEQQLLLSVLGECGDCGPDRQWVGFGRNRRCILCGSA